MNGTVENVGINITSSAEQAIATIRKLNTALAQSNKQFEKMNQHLSKIKGDGGGGSAISKVTTDLKSVSAITPKVTSVMGALAGTLARFITLRSVFRLLGRAFNEMSEFAENYNLFVVSLGEAKDEALQFQNAMNKALGTNMSQTMRYQGFFQNLTTALGATNEQGFLLSKTLTMLTYDMASLFNWSPDVAFQRLQSGIVGQTKPLRYAGVDVTQQTIQPILGELGIDKQVIQLTQYEKVLLRMIAILRQTGNAQGDFSRTIESPANQIRILTDQTKELFRWIGGTFIGLISQALPYINGFVMALVEVFKMLSYLVGFTEDDFDFMNGSGADGLEDFNEELENTNAGVSKLVGNLRKFDEINNISMRSGSSGSAGGGISESTAKLWEELNKQAGYFDDTFANVQSKAKDIKEKIMEWLGIFFELNTEGDAFTGKITGAGQVLLILGGAFAIGGFIGTVAKIVTAIGTINTALTGGAVISGTATGGAVFGVALLTNALIGLGLILTAGVLITGLTWFDKLKTKILDGNKDLNTMESTIIRIAGLLGADTKDALSQTELKERIAKELDRYQDDFRAREYARDLRVAVGDLVLKPTGIEDTTKYETTTLVLDHTTVGKVIKTTTDTTPSIQW